MQGSHGNFPPTPCAAWPLDMMVTRSNTAVGFVAVLVASLVMVSAEVSSAAEETGKTTQDLPATANDLQQPRAQNSPMLLIDPTDDRFVVLANRVDAPSFGCGLQVSGDAGSTFVPAQPVPKLPPGAEKCYGPEIAFDRAGTLYFLFVGLRGIGNTPMGVFLTRSTDNARTFSRPQRLLGPSNFFVRMAINPSSGSEGRIHIVWVQANGDPALGSLPAPPNPILAAHSDDGGRTFSKPVQVNDAQRQLVVAPALAVGTDDAVHVVYYDLGRDRVDYHGLEGPTWADDWSVVISTSNDGGRRFSGGTVVDSAVTPPGRVMLIFTMPPPALAADGSGRVFVAWHDNRNGDWDVFLRRSGDGGRSWGKAGRLNDDRIGNGRHQYLPRLSTAGNGRVDAAFYDRRWDPANIINNLAYTSSGDAGRSFGPNRKISSQGSDSRFGQVYNLPAAKGLVDMGSRVGLASSESGAFLAWADTRNAVRDRHQDVFHAKVVLTERDNSGRQPVVPVTVIGSLTLALLALFWMLARRKSHRRPEAATITGPDGGS